MREDKIFGGKVYTFFDWVWRLMVLNILTIIVSCGLITVCPAVCATFKSIKDNKEQSDAKIFKPWFKNFAYFFKDTFGYSILLLLITGLSIFAFIRYGSIDKSSLADPKLLPLFSIGFVVVVAGTVLILITYIQLPMVMTYLNYGFLDSIRLCFYYAFKHFLTTILEVAASALSLFILILSFFSPGFMPMWLFFGISLPLFCNYLLSRKIYRFAAMNEEEDEDD